MRKKRLQMLNNNSLFGIGAGLALILGSLYFFPKLIKSWGVEKEVSDAIKDGNSEYYGIALRIQRMLGVGEAYSWWNPVGWYEDEDGVIELLNDNRNHVVQIEYEFKKLTGLSLKNVILKYFSSSQIKELKIW